MTPTPQKPVLVAEDEDSDAMILHLAFERAGLTNPLVRVRDGQEAVDYLAGKGIYADRLAYPLPVLLLLDLKMPRMTGVEVLTWLGGREEFKYLPAVVLSSSPDHSDIQRAKTAGAQEYLVKPHNIRELVGLVRALRDRWLSTNEQSAIAGGAGLSACRSLDRKPTPTQE